MTTDAELVQQQIEAARAANAAYMQAKQSGVPIPISQNPTIVPGSYVVPTMSSDVANTSKEQLWRESQAYAAYYGGMSAESIMNQRLESIPVSQRYLDLVNQYGQQHFNIVGSSGVLQYNQSGSYTYGAGYSNEMQGLPFQANTLTQYQQQSLDTILSSPAPMVRDLLNVRGLQTMDPGILSGSINTRINNWQTASNLAGFLTSREERKTYEDWYWGSGPANARTAMDAVFIGRGDGALYAPPPGSVTERFGFDEYGKVLRGGPFSPATRGDSPFNPKMGSGDYRYVGEYRYNTGETVSRFYESSVGSFVDFTKFGVMSEPFVGVRSGGSPGAFRDTRDFSKAWSSIPADTGKTVFTQTKAAAYVQNVGGLPAPFKSTINTGSLQDWKVQSPIGGLLGLTLWGGKKDEVIGGALGSGVDFVTGLVGWTPFKDKMQTVDPMLSSWRTENEKMKATASPEEYNTFLTRSFDAGILTKPITSSTFIENPALTYDYGEFSKWGAGVGENFRKTFLGGASIAQLEAKQYDIEKNGNIVDQFVFGTGFIMSTHPERFISGAIGGGIMVGGGELLGGMYAGSGLAARAGAFAIRHPTTAAVFSGMARYGVPAFLGGATYYGASEGFTASPARTTVNLGKMFPELVGVTHGGLGAWGFTRGIDRGYFGFTNKQTIKPEVPTLDLRPEIDLTKMIPEINLDTMRVSDYVRPSNVATRAEQAMIMRQFQLTPQEIAFAKKTGASLNDILSIRELTMETPAIETIVMPDILTIQMPMMEQATRTKTISLFGTKPMSGSNLVKNLYSRSEISIEPFSSSLETPAMKIGSREMIDSASSTLPVMTREGVRIQVPFLGQMTWQRTVPVSASIRTPSQIPDINHKVRNEPFAPSIPDISKKVPGMTFQTPRKTVPDRPFAPPITVPKKPVPERPYVPGITTPDTRVPRQPVPEGPIPPPFMIPGWPFGGGGGGGSYGRLGVTKWKRDNPVPTLHYLSEGNSVFGRGKRRGKGKRSLGNPFGGGPF